MLSNKQENGSVMYQIIVFHCVQNPYWFDYDFRNLLTIKVSDSFHLTDFINYFIDLILTSGGLWYLEIKGQKWVFLWYTRSPKTFDSIPHITHLNDLIFWSRDDVNTLRSATFRIIKVKKGLWNGIFLEAIIERWSSLCVSVSMHDLCFC